MASKRPNPFDDDADSSKHSKTDDSEEGRRQFSLQGQSGAFSDRQRDVFGGLNALESQHQKFQDTLPVDGFVFSNDNSNDDIVEESSSGGSGFKVPHRPRGGRNFRQLRHQAPDFVANPGKWTKYSLSDVSSEQMSNTSNTSAALDFLRERREQQQQPLDYGDDSVSSTVDDNKPIKFNVSRRKQATTRRRVQDTNSDMGEREAAVEPGVDEPSPSSRGGKWVMPEYVIGQKKKKVKKQKGNKVQSTSNIGLSHLMEDEEEFSSECSSDSTDEEVPSQEDGKDEKKSKRSFRKRSELENDD